MHDDPVTETERWLEEISEAYRKHARCQEMTAERLIKFEELRTRLNACETAERKVSPYGTVRNTWRDRGGLLESYAVLPPGAIKAPGSEERLPGVHKDRDGSASGIRRFEISGDVMSFFEVGISSA